MRNLKKGFSVTKLFKLNVTEFLTAADAFIKETEEPMIFTDDSFSPITLVNHNS